MGLIQSWRDRPVADQILDAAGLAFQGFVVPLIAIGTGQFIFPMIFGEVEKYFVAPWILFLLPLTLVDYLYYWNHRALHSRWLWFSHRVHHGPPKLDLWLTSRNSIFTPLFLIFVWFQAAIIFLVTDPQPFIYGMWLMGLLDLWRHSGTETPAALKFLGKVLILPEDHEWHHSREKEGINFGANLKIWDQMHGTFFQSESRPLSVGSGERGILKDELFRPWKIPR